MFLIEAAKGNDREHEDEIVLQIGTDFRVKDNVLEQPKELFHVHLIQIDDEDDHQTTTTVVMKHLQIITSTTFFFRNSKELFKQIQQMETK